MNKLGTENVADNPGDCENCLEGISQGGLDTWVFQVSWDAKLGIIIETLLADGAKGHFYYRWDLEFST